MCNFLLVGVPKDILPDAPKLTRGLHLQPIARQALPSVFPSDLDAYFLMSGQCSCDLFRVEARSKVDQREAAYRRKGWSEAKIRRALEQVDHSERAHARTPGMRADVRALLQEWFEARHRLVFGIFVSGADPTADIPTTIHPASMKDLTSDSFEPDEQLLMVTS